MEASSKHVIYTSLEEIVNPAHTALVVWDVQNGLVNSAFNKEDFLKNIKSLVAAARSHNVPVIYTKITPLPIPYESPWRLYLQMRRFGVDSPEKLPPFLQPGSPQAEIHSEVSPQEKELILHKHTHSIFIGTYFENIMRNRGIDTILFTGIATEIGISSSARDAASRGFYPVVVRDCVSSSDAEMHEAALKTLQRVSLVVLSQDIMQEWK
ncbi:cysteine hydrolase [Chloroflexota bacterium]